MSVVEKAIAWALAVANDPAHGYDQTRRWGPDYDCSSLVISAFKAAGLPLTATFTGNMKYDFLRNGFRDASELNVVELNMGAGLKRGDVLLNEQKHTAIYLGDGTVVQASINERGGIKGGRSGDQTGREIGISTYRNYPWDIVLRYVGEETTPQSPSATAPLTQGSRGEGVAAGHLPSQGEATKLPLLRLGDTGGAVLSMQTLLIHKWGISCGPDGADGDFGSNTKQALEKLQQTLKLEADGICGPKSWAAIIGGKNGSE